MKLPIGIQTFSEIRERNLLYVDKTEQIHRILTDGKYFFLSRPRRFGKSLLLSTIRAIYEGRQALFDGLWISDQWNWEQQFSTIHLRFSSQGIRTLGAVGAIENMLLEEATRLNVTVQQTAYDLQFKELIEKVAAGSPTKKVVVLIDEYDKPIIDYLEDLPEAKRNRQILKNFFSVLKDSDPYLEFLFITGVSRFAKTSIFSDLNNLTNLSMHPLGMDLLGITEAELEQYFGVSIQEMAQQQGMETQALKSQIKFWYNGYSWDGYTKVYNPFSLLSYFSAKRFNNFWFETGTPSFLVYAMRDKQLYNIEKIEASDTMLDSYELEQLNVITLLFQTGYLTIKEELALGIYALKYPNNEVKVSLEERLLNAFSNDDLGKGKVRAFNMSKAIREGDIDAMMQIVNATFASIPSELWQKENEAFYHALIHLTFSLMGAHVQSEVNSAKGRLDAKVETDEAIYILEFKLDQSADIALAQIESKGYFDAYKDQEKKRVGIGVNVSKKDKKVDEWKSRTF